MIGKNIIFCVKEAAFQLISKQADDCFSNPPCGCANPGKELHCENCSYLEACLSRRHTLKSLRKK
jgi:hypothetical protein